MSRFRGRYDYTVDDKGRLNIPAKWRKLLTPEAQETFVICRAPGDCLWAYPLDEWEKYEEKLDAMPLGRERDLVHRLIHNTLSDSVLDKQGRITVTPLQMQMAGIGKDVTLVGRRSFIEVWDTRRFETYLGGNANFDDVYYAAVTKL
jgi:MraZ protein